MKPVRDSKVPTKLVRQGNVASVSRQGIVASVSRRRKTLTNVVTLEANSSGGAVSDSNVLTEPVQQGIVASVSQKRKAVSDSNVLTELVQQGIVASVSRKRKAKLVTADYGGSIAEVKTRKRLGIVQTEDVISNVKTARVSKKINPLWCQVW